MIKNINQIHTTKKAQNKIPVINQNGQLPNIRVVANKWVKSVFIYDETAMVSGEGFLVPIHS